MSYRCGGAQSSTGVPSIYKTPRGYSWSGYLSLSACKMLTITCAIKFKGGRLMLLVGSYKLRVSQAYHSKL